MTRFPRSPLGRALLLSTTVLALAAGGLSYFRESPAARAQTAAPAPAVAVKVQTMEARPVRIWSSFSGRMRAVDFAEIRPEVSGRITQVRISDSQVVKAGDVLFVIDPAPYEAARARAEANLAAARTNAAFARTEAVRAANLLKTDAIAQRLHDERLNADRVAQAAVLAAEADLKQARIDMDRAYVKAPIAGRVSRAEITVGNVVQAGPGAPLLTSIVSNDGIYADFEMDEQTYLKTVRAAAGSPDRRTAVPVLVTARGDEGRPHQGTIAGFDNRIDTASGTIRARARFDNRDGALIPGMFVSVKVASGGEESALLIPDRAVGSDQSKKFVYVVGDDGRVAYREVGLGAQVDGRRLVTSGLRVGERVIVDGLQHVRPDVPVTVQEASLPPPRDLAAD